MATCGHGGLYLNGGRILCRPRALQQSTRDHPAPACARRLSIGTTPQADGEEEPRHRQLSDGEDKHDQGNVERTKRQVSAASERRKQRFGDLIETELMLLGSSPNRRLMKDERPSPAIAEAATSAPSRQGRLMRIAAQAARRTAAPRPRQVLERPSRGWPSRNTIPHRSDEQSELRVAARTGVAPR